MAKAREVTARLGDARRERPPPELLFRNLLPTEALVALAREQDALYRGVVMVDAQPSSVTMHKLGDSRFQVSVTSQAAGQAREGQAEHTQVEWAVRHAYTELLRHTVQSMERPSRHARAA